MIDFKAQDTGEKHYLIEGRTENICLRMMTAEEYRSIKTLTTEPGKPDYHRGQRYETEKVNEKLSAKLSLRKFIVSWEGIGLDGVELECTDANKERMMEITDFRTFVGDCIEKMVDKNKTIEAARAKNLNDSLNGDSVSEEDSVGNRA